MDIDATSVCGVWFRHVPARGDPLFRPKLPGDGRWQRGETVEGFYLAGNEETAWAEWYRSLAELALPPMRQMPRDLWRFSVDVGRVADLSDEERLARVGLPRPKPTRVEWLSFQVVGEILAAEGWPGILYSSAARPRGSLALCLFRSTPLLPGVEPLPPPARHDEPPAPPTGLRT